MTYASNFSAERMAEEFQNYICENKADERHIRKIMSWFGFMIRGVEKVKTDWWIPRIRQLHFDVGPRRFKIRFNHKDGGGLDIVEISQSRGGAEIGVIYKAQSLTDAERFYLLSWHLTTTTKPVDMTVLDKIIGLQHGFTGSA